MDTELTVHPSTLTEGQELQLSNGWSKEVRIKRTRAILNNHCVACDCGHEGDNPFLELGDHCEMHFDDRLMGFGCMCPMARDTWPQTTTIILKVWNR